MATCGGSPSAEATANGSKAGYLRVVLWPAASAILICTNGMLWTTSWSPTCVTVGTSMRRRSLARAIWRGGESRMVLASSPDSPSSAAAVSFMISGGVASCSRPSSAASSATPIRMLEVTPVRNVPESQRAEISRLSGGPLRPSASSGGSLPSSAMASSVSVIQERRLLPLPVPGFHDYCRDNCLPRGAKSTKAEAVRLVCPLHSPPYHARVSAPPWRRARFSAGNGAAIGLHCGAAARGAKPLTLRHAGRRLPGPEKAVAKNSKNFELVVDTRRGWRLYTPHNEGGAPLATKEFALVKSKESRVSDTLPGPSQKRYGPRHRVCGVGSLTIEY